MVQRSKKYAGVQNNFKAVWVFSGNVCHTTSSVLVSWVACLSHERLVSREACFYHTTRRAYITSGLSHEWRACITRRWTAWAGQHRNQQGRTRLSDEDSCRGNTRDCVSKKGWFYQGKIDPIHNMLNNKNQQLSGWRNWFVSACTKSLARTRGFLSIRCTLKGSFVHVQDVR